MQIDTSTEFGQRVVRRLREEEVAWLVTVGPDGTPEPSPIWFLWDGQSFLIYSKPNAPKVRNIQRSPAVALHLDSGADGEDVIILTGRAEVLASSPGVADVPDYVAKYGAGIARIGLTPESMAATYSTAIRVTPTRLRGH
jgi:PPOX class probable F420-dependent enzyme